MAGLAFKMAIWLDANVVIWLVNLYHVVDNTEIWLAMPIANINLKYNSNVMDFSA